MLIDDETPWVRDYRGLWGLDTRDRFGGERAPSGPRYERDGAVRVSWANPLGWAGLQKVSPDDHDLAEPLAERVAVLEREVSELDATIDVERAALRGLRAQVRSLKTADSTRALAKSREAELTKREAALNQTVATRTSLIEERRAHVVNLNRSMPVEPAQAHVRKPHKPYLDQQDRRTRFLRLWAAISTPLVLACLAVGLVASPLAVAIDITVLAVAFIGVEAIARRRFLSFLGSAILLVVGLALSVGFTLLLLRHWRIAVALLVGAAALVLLFADLRAIRRG